MKRGSRKTAGYKGLDRWEYWWEYNKDRFLSRIPVGIATPTRRKTTREDPLVKARRNFLLPALKISARDRNEVIRAGAMLSMGKLGDLAALPDLYRGSRDESREVRKAAYLGLSYLGAEDVIPILEFAAADSREDVQVRALAAAGLGIAGEPASVQVLVRMVDNRRENIDLRAGAIIALGLISCEESRSELARVLANTREDTRLRSLAAVSLGRQKDLDVVPALLRALGDSSTDILRSAAQALGALNYRSVAQETLDRALRAHQTWMERDSLTKEARRQLLATINTLRAKAKTEQSRVRRVRDKVVRALIQVVERESDLQAKAFALVGLGEIASPQSLEVIRKILDKSSHRLKAWAGIAAGVSGKEAFAPYLRVAFDRKGRDPSERAAMAIGLGLLKDNASASGIARIALDHGEDPDLRGYCIMSLGMMWDPRCRSVLESILDEKGNPSLHRPAAIALGLTGRSDSGGRLIALMDNSNDLYVKAAATIGLGYLRDLRSARALAVEAADKRKPFLARLFSVLAVGYMADRTGSPPLLSRYAWHHNYRVRLNSVDMITSLL